MSRSQRWPTSSGVRDSEDPGGGHLALAPERFAALVRRIKQLP
ncbi:DUF397 domain-containing protein [Actinomadura violacea]|nr:DUF397 domain-containing protein [Actinomadura violacea]